MKALDVAAGPAHAGHASTVADKVVGVDFFDRLFAELRARGPHATGGLEARDGLLQAGAGDPEACRHVARSLILYDTRHPERAAGGDPEGPRWTAELPGYGFEIFRGFRHQVSGFRFLRQARLSTRRSFSAASKGSCWTVTLHMLA